MGTRTPQSTSATGANLDPNQDNCPISYNPDQQNTDSGAPRSPSVGGDWERHGHPGDDATMPNGDTLGDACDTLTTTASPTPRTSTRAGDITYDDNNNGDSAARGRGDDGASWDHELQRREGRQGGQLSADDEPQRR